ncbi:TraR/DksA C4-type zinc finger protein [soil metagenome]
METFDELLRARRAAVLGALIDSADELAGIRAARGLENADDEHDPEGSTLWSDWSRITGMRADAAAQLTAIDAALGRLESGDYGVCVVCGGGIPEARLRARPEAATCVGCAG